MERKGIWDTSWGCFIVLLLFVGGLALFILTMVQVDRSHPNVTSAVAGFSMLAVLFLPALSDLLEHRRYKGKLAARETAVKEKEAALIQREAELDQREADVSHQQTHITQMVRESEAKHIRNIAGRDYLASTSAFRAIHTSPDLKRLTSSMTQDMRIRALQITAKIYSKNSGKEYTTTLENCSCTDFERRQPAPCKHMYRLAAEVGALLSTEDEALNAAILKRLNALQQVEGSFKKEQTQVRRQSKKAKQP